MSQNKEDLKNKIIYRGSYRGSKEMDILMSSFIKSIIDELNINQLEQLNKLVNLEDENLISIKKNQSSTHFKGSFIIEKFIKFDL
tara:strand:+ start:746 stop:1000 length:255 start_codon:yes stop_codon:yes gene_type:complete